MSRRKHQVMDSLELLLDTICNTFGGIVFIAILVVILLQLSGGGTNDQQQTSRSNDIQGRRLQSELAGLQDRISRLEELQENQRSTLELLAPENLKDLLSQTATEQTRRSRLESEIRQLHQQRKSNSDQRQAITEERKVTEQTAVNLQSIVVQLQAELKRQQDARKTILRTTVLHSPGNKQQVIVIAQYDRLYLWHRYGAAGERLGLNTEDFIVLKHGPTSTETTPNPLAGTPLEEGPDTRRKIIARLKQFRSHDAYLAIIVRPDSYDTFRHLRDAVVEAGFEYRLQPTEADEEFIDRGGADGRVQ